MAIVSPGDGTGLKIGMQQVKPHLLFLFFYYWLSLHLNQTRMKKRSTDIKLLLLTIGIYFISIQIAIANTKNDGDTDPLRTSTTKEAIDFLNKLSELAPSTHWPNIKPALFLQNLRLSVSEPMSIYPGKGTNFCGYGALTFLFLQDDPLGYAKLLLQLYSTTLQPLLNIVGAAQRVWANNQRNPSAYPVVSSNDTYPGTTIKRVQYAKHIRLQKKIPGI